MRASVILGTGVAVIGIGFGVYQLWPYVYKPGPEKQALSPQAQARIDQREEAIANDDPALYTKPSTPEELTSIWQNDMQAHVEHEARQMMSGSGLPLDAPRTFTEAAWLAIEPFLLGDYDAYLAAITALGGNLPSESYSEGIRNHFALNADLFQFIPMKPSEARVLQYAKNGMKRESGPDYDWMLPLGLSGKSETTNPNRYPLSGSYLNLKLDVWEMLVPIRLKGKDGKGPGIMSVALAWDPQAKRWMPVAYRLYRSDVGDLPSMVM